MSGASPLDGVRGRAARGEGERVEQGELGVGGRERGGDGVRRGGRRRRWEGVVGVPRIHGERAKARTQRPELKYGCGRAESYR